MLRHVHEKKLHLQWWNLSLLHKATVISLSERYHPHTYTGFHVKLPFAFDKNSRKDLGPNGWGIAYNATFKDRKKGTYGVFGLRNEVHLRTDIFVWFWNEISWSITMFPSQSFMVSLIMRNGFIPLKFMGWDGPMMDHSILDEVIPQTKHPIDYTCVVCNIHRYSNKMLKCSKY